MIIKEKIKQLNEKFYEKYNDMFPNSEYPACFSITRFFYSKSKNLLVMTYYVPKDEVFEIRFTLKCETIYRYRGIFHVRGTDIDELVKDFGTKLALYMEEGFYGRVKPKPFKIGRRCRTSIPKTESKKTDASVNAPKKVRIEIEVA